MAMHLKTQYFRSMQSKLNIKYIHTHSHTIYKQDTHILTQNTHTKHTHKTHTQTTHTHTHTHTHTNSHT